jgi:glycosyltransferase involved in cell wall biosynthesis
MLSVLLPVRNAQATIKSALSSTLRALGPEDELLVGLHKCTDDTEALVHSFLDPRIRVFYFDFPSLSEVLNALISEARGIFVARMDADDVCLPWRFVIQKQLVSKHPEAFIFSTALVRFPTSPFFSLILPQLPIRLFPHEVSKLLENGNPLNHPTFIARKSRLVEIGGYRPVPGEDLDLWLRASLHGVKIYRSAIPTVIYRISEGQLSRNREYRDGWVHSKEIKNLRNELSIFNARMSEDGEGRCSRLKLWIHEEAFGSLRRMLSHYLRGIKG